MHSVCYKDGVTSGCVVNGILNLRCSSKFGCFPRSQHKTPRQSFPVTHPTITSFYVLSPPTDRFGDQGVVACGRSSRRDPDPFLSVRDGDGTRPPAEIQSVHAAAQKQSKKCLLPMLHCHFSFTAVMAFFVCFFSFQKLILISDLIAFFLIVFYEIQHLFRSASSVVIKSEAALCQSLFSLGCCLTVS